MAFNIMDLFTPDVLRQLLGSQPSDPYQPAFAPNAPSTVNRLLQPAQMAGGTPPYSSPDLSPPPGPANQLSQPATPGPAPQNMLAAAVTPQATPPQAAPPITQTRDIPTIQTSAGYPMASAQTTAAVRGPAPTPIAGTQVAAATPTPTFGSRMSDFANSDFGNYLSDTFNGWAQGATPQQSISLGALNAATNGKTRGANNDTIKWLKSRGMDDSQAKMIAGNSGALSEYLKSIYSEKSQNLQNVGKGAALYDPVTKQWITPPAGAEGPTEYGLTPVFGKTADGKTGMGVVGKDGTFHLLDTGGFTPVGNTTQQDLGTTYVTRDKAGNIITTAPIDNSGKAQDQDIGKARAAAISTLLPQKQIADDVAKQVSGIQSDPSESSVLGTWGGNTPNIFPDARRVQAKIDQLKGSAFLAARQMLKGGGAITDYEGQKAEAAKVRMDQAQSQSDFNAALDDFNNAVQEGYRKLEQQATGNFGVPQQGPQGGGQKILRFDAQGNPVQ